MIHIFEFRKNVGDKNSSPRTTRCQMCASYSDLYTLWATAKSTNVDPVLPKLTGMFLGLSNIESMTSWCSKTVPNIFIGCAFAPHEINSLCQEARLLYRNHIHDIGFWRLWKVYSSKCRNINRRLGNMADSALENWWFIFLSSEKILVIRTHPEELHVVKWTTIT